MAGGMAASSAVAGLSFSGGPIDATVRIEPEPLHDLPQTQYGHFIEHLGRCIRGGVWAEGEEDDMFLGGVRGDLVDAVNSINPSLIRYPGGCFADGYHWKDGIGPRNQRPLRRNRAWAKLGKRLGPDEDNHFGTDEFLRLCEKVGAEPQLTANVGSGTAAEAADWVEYCNAPADTKWGSERARNGHPDPYRVKYWFVGNEIFGPHEIGFQRPSKYVKTLHQYAAAMRKVDPDIKIISSGTFMGPGLFDNINPTVLKGAGEVMDYLSVHYYAADPVLPSSIVKYQLLGRHRRPSAKAYYEIMGTLKKQEQFLEHNVRVARKYSPPGKQVPLSFDEWNLWFAFYSDLYIAKFNLRDGLWVASALNMLHRYAPEVPLANIAQMVNCVGIITSTRRGTFLTPPALAYRMYTEKAEARLLPSAVECPPLPGDSGLPALDVSATAGQGRAAIFMVNRHLDSELRCRLQMNGMEVGPKARRAVMHHPDAFTYNTYVQPEAVRIVESEQALEVSKQGGLTEVMVTLEPHSLTCLEITTAPL